MTKIEDELRVLHSALRNLEDKQRRSRDDSYRLQINQLKDMIALRNVSSPWRPGEDHTSTMR